MWVHSPTSTLRPSRGSRHDAAGPSAKGRARQSTTRGRSGLRIALAASVPPDAGGHLFAQGPPARAARSPTGREKGGRKERGGRTGTAPHAFAKKSRKNRMRKHYRSIPEKRDAQESHTHSRRRRQESALREAGLSYRTTCSAPGIKTPRNRRRIRMATQICCRYRPTNRLPGGASPHSSRAAHIERKKGNAYGNTHSLVCAESGKTTENRGIPPPANAAETAPESGRTFGRPLYGPAVLAGSMRCPSECPPSPKSEPRRQGAGRAFGDRFRRTQTRTRTVRQYCRSFRNGYAGRTGRLSDRRPERRTLARNSPVHLLL